MHKKYLKNRYRIICYLLSILILVFPLIIALILGYTEAALFALKLPVSILILAPIFFFYYIFQFVSFDFEGIHLYIFSIKYRTISWQEVVEIKESAAYRQKVYVVVYDYGRELKLDRRKVIKKEIDRYYKQN